MFNYDAHFMTPWFQHPLLPGTLSLKFWTQLATRKGENVDSKSHICSMYGPTFDTKIQPNVGRYGRYTSPMDPMGRCLEGCVCVCGTVLVGEVDIFFFFEMDI